MIGHLQQISTEYENKGLVLIGVNCFDSKSAAESFLRNYKVTFPNVVDNSPEARKIILGEYEPPGKGGAPLEYIIDQNGKVAAAWFGDDSDYAMKVIGGLGVK